MENLMKTMTCKQHGMEMFKQQDAEHLEAMGKIQLLMQQPQAMQDWFQHKKNDFNALSED